MEEKDLLQQLNYKLEELQQKYLGSSDYNTGCSNMIMYVKAIIKELLEK